MSTTQSEQTFGQGDGCCGCNCCADPLGAGGCLMTEFCPCFAFCNGAKDAGLDNGECYCVMTLFGFGCCALIMLGQDIEQKRGLKKHDGCWHCIQATCNGCTCHSCRVVNECKIYAKDGAVGAAPTGTEMTR